MDEDLTARLLINLFPTSRNASGRSDGRKERGREIVVTRKNGDGVEEIRDPR